jgi:hypothetical protein
MVLLLDPPATRRAICSSCGVSWVSVLTSRLRPVAGGQQLRPGLLGRWGGAEPFERLERAAQVLARIGPTASAA